MPLGVKLLIPLNNLRKAISVKLDRELQRELLKKLADVYPERMDMQQQARENEDVRPNLFYLKEHGMIDGAIARPMSEPQIFVNAGITAAGLDFIQDDGGLSAVLGVVTIRLHDETIRDLIAARIQASDLPPAEKTGLLDQLRELRGESIKHLTMKLLDVGMENLPAALPLIQRALGGLL